MFRGMSLLGARSVLSRRIPSFNRHMRVVQVNLVYDDRVADPDALLDRYWTLTGWSDAVAGAGAASAAVVQRFGRDARVVRRGGECIFCADNVAPAVAGLR